MAEPQQPSDSGPGNLADLVSKGLAKVGATVFSTPSSSSVQKVRSATVKVLREIGLGLRDPLKRPLTLACAADDALLVLDRPQATGFRLMRFQTDREQVGVVCEIPKGNADAELMEPVSLVVDAEQQLYLVDAQEACIKKYNAEGRWLDTFRSAGPTGKLFEYPLDAAVDEAGNLLIADSNNNRIVQLLPDGELGWVLESFSPGAQAAEPDEFNEPCSVCVGRGRILRVADRNQNRVLGFDAQRKLIALWADLSFPSLVRMAADGASVLVAERNRILRYSASGAVTATIEFPLDLGNQEIASGGGAFTVDVQGNLLVIDPVRESILVLGFVEK